MTSPDVHMTPAPTERRGNKKRRIDEAMMVTLPPDYRPTEGRGVHESIKPIFRQKLLRWRTDLPAGSRRHPGQLSEGGIREADVTDRASVETDRALGARDRARKLVNKIDRASRTASRLAPTATARGGEPISLRRLEARPIALLSIRRRSAMRRMERVHRDD